MRLVPLWEGIVIQARGALFLMDLLLMRGQD